MARKGRLAPRHGVVGGPRPVHEPEVEVLDAEPLEAQLEALERRLVPVVRAPVLRHDEHVRADEGGGGGGGAGGGSVARARLGAGGLAYQYLVKLGLVNECISLRG